MKLLKFFPTLAISAILSAPFAGADDGIKEPPEGFVALFNGKDLTGWFGHGTKDPRPLFEMDEEKLKEHWESTMADINKHWSVKDGVLINDGHGLYLSTRKNYGDFELLLEYKTVPKADSGIYLRGCPQVQIWDSTDEKKFGIGADKGSGGLWNNPKGSPGKDPLKKMDKPFGEWNQFRIIMIGERVSVWLNGEKVVDDAVMANYFDKGNPIFPKGPIQLQTHGGEIQWRNIFIREIDTEEANAMLSNKDSNGFVSLFNGEDLSGWVGATEEYEVKNGAIYCKPGKGGNLFAKDEYGNVALRFEFKLPPGGNNGIAMRTPMGGHPANDGIEVQVLDHTHPKYAGLKDYQFHGSVYKHVPAKIGFLRPVGEWNFEEIVYDGSKIRVTLNGTTIVDADLSKIDAPDAAGIRKKSGYLGFAGHNDPVGFRNISVKTLD